MFSRAQQAVILAEIKTHSLEVALYSTTPTASDTGTEAAGGAYTRTAVSFGANTAVSDGTQILNTGLVSFPQASSDYNALLTHWGVRMNRGASRKQIPISLQAAQLK